MKIQFHQIAVFFVSFFAIPSLVYSQGKIMEDLSISSSSMGKDMNYSVYLPPDYEDSNRYYPVVYLLHGYSDDDSGWIQFGEANRLLDAAIMSGEIPPIVLILPDGEVSFYVNSSDGKVMWEDYFLKELQPKVESEYRIRAKKEYRGVAGLSMGGYGSLILALRNPDNFAAVAAFSSAVTPDEQMVAMPQDQYDFMFGVMHGRGLEGEERLSDHWKAHSVLEIVKTGDLEELKKVRYYIDCGDDDFLAIGNSMLHIEMLKKEVPHQYRVRDGAHTWSYWRTGLVEGLKFIGESFRR